MLDLPLPVEFRGEIIEPLLNSLRGGESCSLIGVGSSGKSNLARHLARLDVREHYLGQAARSMLAVYVDCAKLTDYTLRSLHGLILEAVSNAVQESSLETATLHRKLESLWEQAAEAAVPDKARRALEEAIASVLRAGITQVFVILDDFDHVVQKAPGPVLNSLRALRDNFKAELVYVTVTRRELAFLRNENEYQDFHELVCCETMPIGPYRESDARLMMDRLVLRWGLPPLSEAERQRLWQASGGHAGLLRAILLTTRHDRQVDLLSPRLIQDLRGHKDVEPECGKIWESLEEEEKRELQALASQSGPLGVAVRPLERKSLIRRRLLDGTFDIFSPVLADFVRGALPGGRVTIKLAPEQHQVLVEGRTYDLTSVEYQLFDYLNDLRGRVVSRQKLIKVMIEAEQTIKTPHVPGNPEHRLDSHMDGIRRKINVSGEYIIREPDGRYRLVDADGK